MNDIGGLVRSVNPVSPGQALLADDELDALLVLVGERNDESGIEALTRRVEPSRQGRRGRLVAAAAAVVILVVLVPLLLSRGDTGSDVATTALPTTALQPTAPTDVAAWFRVPPDGAVFGGTDSQSMWDVTAGGPGLVAVGEDGPDAAVWASLDGTAWLRVPHDEEVFGGAGIASVTVGGPGLVAVGSSAETACCEADATVWTSVDGITWTRWPLYEQAFGGEGGRWMNSVTVGGPGLVAVGADGSNAAVWTSSDGITWTRVPHHEATFGGEGVQEMLSVTAAGPGLVAVGRGDENLTDDTVSDLDAAVWTSPDGITWTRVPHDEAAFGGGGDQEMLSVIAGGSGLVAVGADFGAGRTPVWTSPDGVTWGRVPDDPTVRGPMMSVIAAGPGLVGVGAVGPGLVGGAERSGSPPVWTSVDGVAWTRVAADEAASGWWKGTMTGVTAGGPGLVAVGFDPGIMGGDAAVWNAAAED